MKKLLGTILAITGCSSMVQASESFLHALVNGDIEAFMRDRAASRERESGNTRSYPSILEIPESAAESFKAALCDGNTSVLDAMVVQHPGIQHNFCYRQTRGTDYEYPILMAVEKLQDVSVKWLLDHGVKATNRAMCVLARVPCCDKKDAEKVRKIESIFHMFVAAGVVVEDDYQVQPMYEAARKHNHVMIELLAKTRTDHAWNVYDEGKALGIAWMCGQNRPSENGIKTIKALLKLSAISDEQKTFLVEDALCNGTVGSGISVKLLFAAGATINGKICDALKKTLHRSADDYDLAMTALACEYYYGRDGVMQSIALTKNQQGARSKKIRELAHDPMYSDLLSIPQSLQKRQDARRNIKPILKPIISSVEWAKQQGFAYQEHEPLPAECFVWPQRTDLRDNPQCLWLQSCKPAEIKSLLEHRILDPNVQDADGNTLLHYALADTQAAASGYQKIFLLLSYGANRRLKNKEGKTAFEVSRLPINLKGNIVGDIYPSLRENTATQPIPIDEQEGHKLQYYHNVV